MDQEFKRMMKLAGLTEIKIIQPKIWERYENIETLEELEKILPLIFPKSSITLENEAETEDREGQYFINIDSLNIDNNTEITHGFYQLWDIYNTSTDEEKSFMSTPKLLEWLYENIK
jgi:hypothetical protein